MTIKFSELTAAGALTGAEIVAVVQSGNSRRTTAQAIADLGGGLSNPMTTAGDVIVGGASGTPERLAVGTEGYVLTVVSGTPAWVASAGGASWPAVTASASTSIVLGLTDAGDYLRTTAASAVSIEVPPQSSVSWATDTEIHIEQAGEGAVSIVAGSGVTINHLATRSMVIEGRYGVVTLKRVGTNTWTLFGALGAA